MDIIYSTSLLVDPVVKIEMLLQQTDCDRLVCQVAAASANMDVCARTSLNTIHLTVFSE